MNQLLSFARFSPDDTAGAGGDAAPVAAPAGGSGGAGGGVDRTVIDNLQGPAVKVGDKEYRASEIAALVKERDTIKGQYEAAESQRKELADDTIAIFADGKDAAKATAAYRRSLARAGYTGEDLNKHVASFQEQFKEEVKPAAAPKSKEAGETSDEVKQQLSLLRSVAAQQINSAKIGVVDKLVESPSVKVILDGILRRGGEAERDAAAQYIRSEVMARFNQELRKHLDTDGEPRLDRFSPAGITALTAVLERIKPLVGDPSKMGKVPSAEDPSRAWLEQNKQPAAPKHVPGQSITDLSADIDAWLLYSNMASAAENTSALA